MRLFPTNDQVVLAVRSGRADALLDTYGVDLTFKPVSGGAESHYVWQVNVSSKQVTPLSALARNLAVK